MHHLALVFHYYLLIFGYNPPDGAPPPLTHTWATFVKASAPEGASLDEPDAWTLEPVTISWLPRQFPICTLCGPTSGRNYTLEETFRQGLADRVRLAVLPVQETLPSLYEAAVRQKRLLDGGQVQYVVIDRRWREGSGALNCIHAVADVHRSGGILYTGTERGIEASQTVLRWLNPYFVRGAQVPWWLEQRLGLTRYPLNRVGWGG